MSLFTERARPGRLHPNTGTGHHGRHRKHGKEITWTTAARGGNCPITRFSSAGPSVSSMSSVVSTSVFGFNARRAAILAGANLAGHAGA